MENPSSSPTSHADFAEHLLARRYGGPEHEILYSGANEVLNHLLSHRSVRAFLPDAVPESAIHVAVAAAQSAASSQNLQLWSVIAIQDRKRIARFTELSSSQEFIRDTPLFLVWLADLSRLTEIGSQAKVNTEPLEHLEPLIVGIVDVALAAQNAAIAFEALGFGSVYIGATRYQPKKVTAELGLPPHVLPIFGMCVGYPDPQRPFSVKPRLPIKEVLHHEHYDSSQRSSNIARYDAKMREFQQQEGLRQVTWSENSLNRVLIFCDLVQKAAYRQELDELVFAK